MTFKEFAKRAREIKPRGTLFVSVEINFYDNDTSGLNYVIWNGSRHFKGGSVAGVLKEFEIDANYPYQVSGVELDAVGEVEVPDYAE